MEIQASPENSAEASLVPSSTKWSKASTFDDTLDA
jgi:hypothetical protein